MNTCIQRQKHIYSQDTAGRGKGELIHLYLLKKQYCKSAHIKIHQFLLEVCERKINNTIPKFIHFDTRIFVDLHAITLEISPCLPKFMLALGIMTISYFHPVCELTQTVSDFSV